MSGGRMRTIEMDVLESAPRYYCLRWHVEKGREVEAKETFPRFTVVEVGQRRRTGERVYGLFVQMRPRAHRRWIARGGSPSMWTDRDKADRLARWLNDPEGTREEWDGASEEGHA